MGEREERERQTRRRIGELAENLRKVAGALPFWRVDDSGPEIVVVGTDLDEPLSDTSRRGQYHNKKYWELAVEVGLTFDDAGTGGWDYTSVRESTRDAYEVEVRKCGPLTESPGERGRRRRRPPAAAAGRCLCACPYQILT